MLKYIKEGLYRFHRDITENYTITLEKYTISYDYLFGFSITYGDEVIFKKIISAFGRYYTIYFLYKVDPPYRFIYEYLGLDLIDRYEAFYDIDIKLYGKKITPYRLDIIDL